MSDNDIVLFKRYPTEMDAEMARSVLECEGIPAIVLKDDAGGMEPQLTFVRGVRLMIRAGDLERVREILDEENLQP